MLYVGIDIIILAVYGCILCAAARFIGMMVGLDRGERETTVLATFLTALFMIVGYAVMVEIFDLMF